MRCTGKTLLLEGCVWLGAVLRHAKHKLKVVVSLIGNASVDERLGWK